MQDPFSLFQLWYDEERRTSTNQLPAACCLSTVGLDGCPNARFVSLKAIEEGAFIVTGSWNSRKGIELKNHPQAALTFWWDQSLRQVRIQGEVTPISNESAKLYFSQRSSSAKYISSHFNQGQEIGSLADIKKIYSNFNSEQCKKSIDRPKDWGGFSIQPLRVEFMTFKMDRLHERRLFEMKNKQWVMHFLEP